MIQDERFLAGFTAEERAAAERMNEAGKEIDRQVWGNRPPPDSRHYVLDERGVCVAVGMGTWAVWFERESREVDGGRRRVGRDEWDDPTWGHVCVSTVFLGLDHGFGGGARKLFETMVFWGWSEETARSEQWMERYSTLGQAQLGHARAADLTRRFLAGEITRAEYEA